MEKVSTKTTEPSYTELVYEALRSAEHPLTIGEIADAVNARRPITTRNPKATIRNALTQGRLLVSMGDGRYGYLPHLLAGSLLRVPLSEKKPANHPLIWPDDVRGALWPGFFEIAKRRDTRPVDARLPNGAEVALALEPLARGVWGTSMPEGLRQYLVQNYAAPGDSLLIRVTDGETRRFDLWFEPRRKRDSAAVERRNRELADCAYQILRDRRGVETFIWDLVDALLARGAYRSEVAPDPIEAVLRADSRFVDAGFDAWMLAETLTPDIEAQIRSRKKFEGELFAVEEGQEIPEVAVGPSVQSTRRSMERSFADVGAILAEHEFSSLEEANTFLQELLAGGGIPRRTSETPIEQAQDLMYDAWEEPNRQKRIKLAKRALEISPDCADAYVLLAEETARDAAQAADLYAKGVAAGERALGKRAFAEDVGEFWGIIQTRPYMRARLGLAQSLSALGKQREAIGHAWEMLRLNPNDNQGVRDVLLAWLLERDDRAEVAKLLDLYPEDAGATWQYGRALQAFRTEGDTNRSRRLLAEARAQNRYVPDYLLGNKRLPSRLPETIGFGDEKEAIYYAVEQGAAWLKTPAALAWLGKHKRGDQK